LISNATQVGAKSTKVVLVEKLRMLIDRRPFWGHHLPKMFCIITVAGPAFFWLPFFWRHFDSSLDFAWQNPKIDHSTQGFATSRNCAHLKCYPKNSKPIRQLVFF
jgi:hypothetical protein